ncbi:MAG: phospholipase D-like domain-containing protein [Marivita sp.]|uniref:phospholipase D family protein n=1 Tax=Marivita sp. TaxID=2003365 RepID=UPI0025BB72C7|nr:phospholipase D-like domain-containing protein [Marivita sp.]MCI5111448.1 phospholipase D-like domain-containing protein [Marivita sp.]
MFDPLPETQADPVPDVDVLITAEEAWPAFERAVLRAQSHVHGSFRVFDLRTRLRSPEARAVGHDWFDLLAHVIRRGVKVTIVVSDFDPVMATPLHELTWQTVRQGAALTEIADARAGQVRIFAALHPARAGVLPWGMLLPAVIKRKWDQMAGLSKDRLSRQAVLLDRTVLPELRTVTHHQKLAVIDDDTLFIGGLDLNERRFDTLDHDRPARETWSDVHLMVRGKPEVAEAQLHLDSFLEVSAGRRAPPSLGRIRRTISAPRRVQFPYLSPLTVLNEIEETHIASFNTARHLIHIETQFLRSSVIADALAHAARRNPDLHLLAILPALPESLAFYEEDGLDTRFGMCLQRDAVSHVQAAFGDRALFASPVRPVMASREGLAVLAGSPMVYVHNKVLVQDDDFALIGSGNLNGRSMRWDTEAAVALSGIDTVARLRARLLNHWWFDDLPAEAMEPETLVPWWSRAIAANAVCLPENRTGFLVPYDPDNRADLAQALPGITENIV